MLEYILVAIVVIFIMKKLFGDDDKESGTGEKSGEDFGGKVIKLIDAKDTNTIFLMKQK